MNRYNLLYAHFVFATEDNLILMHKWCANTMPWKLLCVDIAILEKVITMN